MSSAKWRPSCLGLNVLIWPTRCCEISRHFEGWMSDASEALRTRCEKTRSRYCASQCHTCAMHVLMSRLFSSTHLPDRCVNFGRSRSLPRRDISVIAYQITGNPNFSFRPMTRKTSKPRITGILWGESTGDRWIPLTKGQYYGKRRWLCT